MAPSASTAVDERARVAVLISGRGSNMASLLAAAARSDYPAEIVRVISNRPMPPACMSRLTPGWRRWSSITAAGTALSSRPTSTPRLRAAGVELVCLAGFMRLLSAPFVGRWHDRILNIHPSLLPAFPGLDTHERALAAGVKVHGCTVHFVRAKVDDGPIVAQGAVAVLSDDTADSLAARVLAVEHQLYPHALALVASGRARVDGGRVAIGGAQVAAPALISPAL